MIKGTCTKANFKGACETLVHRNELLDLLQKRTPPNCEQLCKQLDAGDFDPKLATSPVSDVYIAMVVDDTNMDIGDQDDIDTGMTANDDDDGEFFESTEKSKRKRRKRKSSGASPYSLKQVSKKQNLDNAMISNILAHIQNVLIDSSMTLAEQPSHVVLHARNLPNVSPFPKAIHFFEVFSPQDFNNAFKFYASMKMQWITTLFINIVSNKSPVNFCDGPLSNGPPNSMCQVIVASQDPAPEIFSDSSDKTVFFSAQMSYLDTLMNKFTVRGVDMSVYLPATVWCDIWKLFQAPSLIVALPGTPADLLVPLLLLQLPLVVFQSKSVLKALQSQFDIILRKVVSQNDVDFSKVSHVKTIDSSATTGKKQETRKEKEKEPDKDKVKVKDKERHSKSKTRRTKKAKKNKKKEKEKELEKEEEKDKAQSSESTDDEQNSNKNDEGPNEKEDVSSSE